MTDSTEQAWRDFDELRRAQSLAVELQTAQRRQSHLRELAAREGVYGVVGEEHQPCNADCAEYGTMDRRTSVFICRRHGKRHDCINSTRHPHVIVTDDGDLVCTLTGRVISAQILDSRTVKKRADHGDGGGKRTRGFQELRGHHVIVDREDTADGGGDADGASFGSAAEQFEGDDDYDGGDGGIEDGRLLLAAIECDVDGARGKRVAGNDDEAHQQQVLIDELEAELEKIVDGRTDITGDSPSPPPPPPPPPLESAAKRQCVVVAAAAAPLPPPSAPPHHIQSALFSILRRAAFLSGTGTSYLHEQPSDGTHTLAQAQAQTTSSSSSSSSAPPPPPPPTSALKRKALSSSAAATAARQALESEPMAGAEPDTLEFVAHMQEIEVVARRLLFTLFNETRQRRATAQSATTKLTRAETELRSYLRACTKQGQAPRPAFVTQLQQAVVDSKSTQQAPIVWLVSSGDQERLLMLIQRTWAALHVHLVGKSTGAQVRNIEPQFVLGMLHYLRAGFVLDGVRLFEPEPCLSTLPSFAALLQHTDYKHNVLTNGRNRIKSSIVRARDSGESLANLMRCIHPQRLSHNASVRISLASLPSADELLSDAGLYYHYCCDAPTEERHNR